MDSESLPKTEAAVELPKFNIKTKVDMASTFRKVRPILENQKIQDFFSGATKNINLG